MPAAHRHSDLRDCGAKTVVENQSSVFVNNKLWAVNGDPNDHGDGQLINTGTTVFINRKNVIVHFPDHAQTDDASHTDPMTAEGSDNVYCYG